MSDMDLSTLQGKHCQLLVYARGYMPRDILYLAWRVMEDEKGAEKIMYGQATNDALPYSQRGDLVAFCDFFSQPGRFLTLAMAQATGECAGFIWFDDITPGHQANVSIYIRSKYFGPLATEAGHLAIHHGFTNLKVKTLWAFTPWKEAAAYAQRLGFKHVGALERYAMIRGTPHDMHILVLRHENYQPRDEFGVDPCALG